MPTIRAEIEGRMLVWARGRVRMSPYVAANKLRVPIEQLEAWEAGKARPTINQLRKIARVYGQNLAAFYLPEPPDEFDPNLPDYRRHAGTSAGGDISPELALDIRTNAERRETYLELLRANGETPVTFAISGTLNEGPEAVATRLRAALGISNAEQRAWRDENAALQAWRAALEQVGILVFQTSKVPLKEMRGYSIAEYPAPVIVLNRKDWPRSRCFTLIHEAAHLLLRRSGICDLSTDLDAAPEDQPVEVFCNHVAAATLVPRERLLTENLVTGRGATEAFWSDDDLRELSRRYSVSIEVILRRLLTLGRATRAQYEAYRRSLEGIPKKEKAKGPVPVPVNTLSLLGRPYVAEVLDALGGARVTAADVAAFLGVRTKHFDALSAAVEP